MVPGERFWAFVEESVPHFLEVFYPLGVGVNGFLVPRVSLSARRADFSVGGISSMIEITLVNRRCSESDLAVFGLGNL